MAQEGKLLRLLMGPRFGFWKNGKVLKLDCVTPHNFVNILNSH